MTSPANNLKESDFITGSILYHILDLTNGTFKIQNTARDLIAEASNLKFE